MSISTSLIDPLVYEAFKTAVQTVFEQTTGTAFEATEMTSELTKPSPDQYSAYIQLLRVKRGVVALQMSPTMMELLSKQFFHSTQEPTPDLFNDILREWVNVIAGQAKTILKGTPFHYQLSIPQSGFIPEESFIKEFSFSIRFTSSEGTMELRVILPPGIE